MMLRQVRVVVHYLKSLSMGAFTWSSVPVGGGADNNKKEFLRCSAFEWGTKKGLEFKVVCLFVSITVCSNSLL